ncbi:Ada metal-binding domain-containing protein [Amycolatopsis sp. NPDC051903]
MRTRCRPLCRARTPHVENVSFQTRPSLAG